MPTLINTRHELFCQALAKGKSEIDAYTEAGYVRDDGNCCRLAQKPHIKVRVREIMEKAAKRTEITAARILQGLAGIGFFNPADCLSVDDAGQVEVDLSRLDREQAGAIDVSIDIDDDGKTKTRIKLADTQTRKAALETLGRAFALFTDRTEHVQPDTFSNVKSTEELIEQVRKELGDADADALSALLYQHDSGRAN
jgi:phage terminase small subunit